MPAELYEIVALAARFWFLFLMALIVWRSYRWYARERRQSKKRLRLLPDAGYIGELVVLKGDGELSEGTVLSVPFEGTLGFLRSNDLCIPAPGVANRHLWFSYHEKRGLVLTPSGRNDFSVDEVTIAEKPKGLCMGHGSRLYIGECELRLRMFAGYEVQMQPRSAAAYPLPEEEPQPDWQPMPQGQAAYGYPQPYPQPYAQPGYGPQGYAQPMNGYAQPGSPMVQPYPQPYAQPGYGYGPQGYAQPMPEGQAAYGYPQPYDPPNPYAAQPSAPQPAAYAPPGSPAYDVQAYQRPPEAQPPLDETEEAYEEPQAFHPLMDEEAWDEAADWDEPARQQEPPTMVEPKPVPPEAFYPLEAEDEWPLMARPEEWHSQELLAELYDEDGTDATTLPRSAYVGRDDAAWAKRHIWDKTFGGGGGK